MTDTAALEALRASKLAPELTDAQLKTLTAHIVLRDLSAG